MKAIICQEPGHLVAIEVDPPVRQAGETLLKIKRVGICGTDLHAYGGNQAYFTYPRILGHELSATVVEVDPDNDSLQSGDQVVIMPYLYCGICIACRNGRTNCCANLKVYGVHVDGGMQEYVSYPTHLLMKAEGLNLDELAIVEPLAIGAHAISRAQIQPGETAVVVGCGPIGIGAIKLAQLAGAEVIVIDVNQDRLSFCQEKLGVTHVVNALENPVEQVMKITNNDGATAVFDATGNRRALEAGVQYMAAGGRYILIGLSKGDLTFNHPAIHAKEATIMCSRNATTEDFKSVISVLQSGKFPVEAYITHRENFDNIPGEFEQWTLPENQVVKAMTMW